MDNELKNLIRKYLDSENFAWWYALLLWFYYSDLGTVEELVSRYETEEAYKNTAKTERTYTREPHKFGDAECGYTPERSKYKGVPKFGRSDTKIRVNKFANEEKRKEEAPYSSSSSLLETAALVALMNSGSDNSSTNTDINPQQPPADEWKGFGGGGDFGGGGAGGDWGESTQTSGGAVEAVAGANYS